MRIQEIRRQPDTARRAFAFALLFAPAAMTTATASDEEPAGEQLARRFWNAVGLGAWNDLDGLVLPTYRHHTPDGAKTLAGFKGDWTGVYHGLAGHVLAIDALVSQADTVAVRWNAQGVHVASFYGERVTGKLIVIRGMTFHRIEQQRIAEDWDVTDFDGFKRQLGVR